MGLAEHFCLLPMVGRMDAGSGAAWLPPELHQLPLGLCLPVPRSGAVQGEVGSKQPLVSGQWNNRRSLFVSRIPSVGPCLALVAPVLKSRASGWLADRSSAGCWQ